MQQWLLLIGLAALIFFMIWRQGQSRKKALAQLQSFHDSLQEGDRVVTTSGIRGTVREVREETLDLELAPGVVTEWIKLAVREKVVLPALVEEKGEDSQNA